MAKVDFKIQVGGKETACTYEVVGDGVKTITVTTPFGVETTGLGGLPSDVLARKLAQKMVLRAEAAEPGDFSRTRSPW